MKRIISMLLVVLMLAGMMVSCATTPDNPSVDSGNNKNPENNSGVSSDPSGSSDNPSGKPEYDSDGYLNDALPDKLDYGGQSVYMLGWENRQNDLWPTEGSTNAPIQDTSYWHKKGVEDRFNIVFDTRYVLANWGNQATFMTAARAEDASYDLIHTYSNWPPILAMEGRLANLLNLQYPDLDKPWWPESADAWKVNDSLYYLGSNSSIAQIQSMHVVFAHLQMIEEEGLPSPITATLRGNWTLEAMGSYIKQFAGLAEANPGEAYGFWVPYWFYPEALYYAAFDNVRRTADGSLEIAYDNEETLTLITDYIDQLHDIFRGPEMGMAYSGNFDPMLNQQAALVGALLSDIQRMEDTTAYAPLPYPKWSREHQENYRVLCSEVMDLWCIPISTTNKELCGMLMEGIASSEYRNVAPFYYEQYLKKRYSSDAEGMKCFDLVRQSIVYDFGRTLFALYHNSSTTQAETLFRYCFWSENSTNGVKRLQNIFVSRYRETITQTKTHFNSVLEEFRKNNQQ